MASDLSPLRQAEMDMSVDTIVAAGQLLSNPRWAKIWFSLHTQDSKRMEDMDNFLSGGVTAQEVIDKTGIPQTTVYQDLNKMEERGCVMLSKDEKPREYSTSSMHFFVSNHPGNIGEDYYVDPSLIGVVGEAYEDDDVETFLDRNNYTKLNHLIEVSMNMLSNEGVDASLENYVPELDSIDAALIEPAIRRVLREVGELPLVDWEYPDD